MVSRIGEIGIQYGTDETPSIPSPTRERVTIPDIIVPQADAVDKTRTRTKEVTGYSQREQELVAKICSADNMERDRLKSLRKAVVDGKLTFAEYHDPRTWITYLYITPNFQVPVSSTAYRWTQVDREEPKTPTLLRVGPEGVVTEIHSWKD